MRGFPYQTKSRNEPYNTLRIKEPDVDISEKKTDKEDGETNALKVSKTTTQTVTKPALFDRTKVPFQENTNELENLKTANQRLVEALSRERYEKAEALRRYLIL